MNFRDKKILVLAPHGDDESLGCGGTISHLIESGNTVHVVAFSQCNNDDLLSEFQCSTAALGVQKAEMLNFPVRNFNSVRQPILDLMVSLNKSIKPDVVFVPCSTDQNQDHEVISREAFRAFKFTTILGYELIWNMTTSQTQCVVKLKDYHIRKKIEAIGKYKSQSGRRYTDPGFIANLARVRGTQNDCEFAECFEVIKLRYE